MTAALLSAALLVAATLDDRGGRSHPVFFDMKHSNNAARIRLWRALKEGMTDEIERRVVSYPDLKSSEFAAINPLKKVPAFIRKDGSTVFESHVILGYLEDKYDQAQPSFTPATPEGRQLMQLFIRIHDLYIASPNCCASGFSHCQGAMYLSYGWHGAARGMDLPTREAKIGEIWRQLNWLEAQVASIHAEAGGSYLLGQQLTLADFTWFPTCVFMEFLLPRVFGWADPFAIGDATPFPSLARWYTSLREGFEPFKQARAEIWDYWIEMEAKGQFACIIEEMREAEAAGHTYKWTYGVPQLASLHYQAEPPPGKRTGRYIGRPDEGDVADEHVETQVHMRDGRELTPPPTLESHGFELREWPTQLPSEADGSLSGEASASYYEEMEALVKAATGATRVCVFDHTVRESGQTNLNALNAGSSAAPVPRVHCDYTADGAPRRLRQLAREGKFSNGEPMSDADIEALAAGRFAFINVWRSLDTESPVLQKPLAVCDEASVAKDDIFLYELIFADRTGENYSLRPSDAHKWYTFPRMVHDECLIFKVYDKPEDGPRFVFHTAFDDPSTPPDAPPRRSLEVRTIAFFDDDVPEKAGSRVA